MAKGYNAKMHSKKKFFGSIDLELLLIVNVADDSHLEKFACHNKMTNLLQLVVPKPFVSDCLEMQSNKKTFGSPDLELLLIANVAADSHLEKIS